MKRTLLALALAAATAPLFAASDDYKLVARVNGREITNADLNAQWSRVPAKLQEQYLKNGGKAVFLDNYISKKLIVMDAVASGFAKKIGVTDDLDPAAESALFDRYVREVVAAPIITEGEMQKAYTDNKAQFTAPEQAHLSIIRALKKDNPTAAKEALAKVVVEVFSARTTVAAQVSADRLADALAVKFGEIAARTSDDASAAKGGDLGWVALHTLDPRIANAARAMKPGAISGILESGDSYQIVLLHEYRPAGVEPYEAAKDALREYLMARNSRKVMQAVKEKTAQLRAAGKVEVFAENLR
ncbi:MAG TPA: peptidyl-prolyl cis-trans isomerase [Thermoanaerobaculia bacterium]